MRILQISYLPLQRTGKQVGSLCKSKSTNSRARFLRDIDQGRSLFESLNTYINLTEQMRQLSPEDDAFRGFLSRARTGSVTMQDMNLINSKVRSKEQIESLDLDLSLLHNSLQQ